MERGDWWCSGSRTIRTKSYIKRVIGLPGDTVELRDGMVVINGRPLPEGSVPEEYRDRQSPPAGSGAAGNYYVRGPTGLVQRQPGVGAGGAQVHLRKAVFVYWPLEKMGRCASGPGGRVTGLRKNRDRQPFRAM